MYNVFGALLQKLYPSSKSGGFFWGTDCKKVQGLSGETMAALSFLTSSCRLSAIAMA